MLRAAALMDHANGEDEGTFRAEGDGRNVALNIGGGCNGLPSYVMTEEQLESLRRQIAVYATICHQLVEMHCAAVKEQASGPAASTPKVNGRQRWIPSQKQLHILERLFRKGGGTPDKLRIRDITAELSRHGCLHQTNVYNWFQNRKARVTKRQQRESSKGSPDRDKRSRVKQSNSV